jgi:hypothetical protein
MYDIGEKPGIGRYCCTNCGWSVNLDDASDRLPRAGAVARARTRRTTAAERMPTAGPRLHGVGARGPAHTRQQSRPSARPDGPHESLHRRNRLLAQLHRVVRLAGRGGGLFQDVIWVQDERL